MSTSNSMTAGDSTWAKAHYEHDLKPAPAEVGALIKTQFFCRDCHGTNLVSDAPCKWDIDKQEWVRVGEVYEDTHCEDCETEVKVYTKEIMA